MLLSTSMDAGRNVLGALHGFESRSVAQCNEVPRE